MYQALYRKWRPRTFDEVVGQPHITETLRSQSESGRLSHAYLFTGTRGTGKTTCAKILAKAVNCLDPQNGNPCNKCKNCLGIDNGSILDVLEFDAASNSRVDDIRAVLEETVFTPATAKKRVYIIDEVHMLSTSAFNALLKTLEEPPEHILFILATTELHKVPATILSRCQRFAFRRIEPQTVAGRVLYVARQEKIPLTEDGAELLARLSDGAMRDALSLLDQCAGESGTLDADRLRDILGVVGRTQTASLLEAVCAGDTASALSQFSALYAGGKEIKPIFEELSLLCRDVLMLKTAPEGAAGLVSRDGLEAARGFAGKLTASALINMILLIQETQQSLLTSANGRLDAELCLVRLCCPPEKPLSESAPESPRVPEPPVKREAERPAEPPAKKEPEKTAEPRPLSGNWPKILAAVKPRLSVPEYAPLSNIAMVKPVFSENRLTLLVAGQFQYGIINSQSIIDAIKSVSGLSVEVRLEEAPAKPDRLDELIAFGEKSGIINIK